MIVFHTNPFKVSLMNSRMGEKEMVKMAVIAGASYALRYKGEHPMASESEIINFVARETNKIIHELKKDWEDD
jgi:hypothetical protein